MNVPKELMNVVMVVLILLGHISVIVLMDMNWMLTLQHVSVSFALLYHYNEG